MIAASDDRSTPWQLQALSGRRHPADYYRQKSDECIRLAEQALNEELRDQFLRLANAWTGLVIQMEWLLPRLPIDDADVG